MKRFALGLCLIGATTACSGASAPEGVVETFMLGMQDRRCDGVADSLTATSRRMAGSKVEAACRRGVMKARGKQLAGLTLVDKQEDGNRATVRLQPRYADGSTDAPQSFVLLREDGGWKLDLLATGVAARERLRPGAAATNAANANTQ